MSDVDFKDVATAAAVVAAAYFTAGAGLVAAPGAGGAAAGSTAAGTTAAGTTAAGTTAAGTTAAGTTAAGTTAAGTTAAGTTAAGTTAAGTGAAATGTTVLGMTPGQAALTGATLGSVGMSIAAQQEAAQQQRVANAARQRVSEIQNRRARLRTLEEQRIRGAQTQVAGVGAGVGTASSPIQGTVASLRSQAAQNIGMQQTMAAGERSIFAAEQTAARAGARADLFGQASQIGVDLGGYTPVRNLFGG